MAKRGLNLRLSSSKLFIFFPMLGLQIVSTSCRELYRDKQVSPIYLIFGAGSNQIQHPARGPDIFMPLVARHSPEGLVK